MDALLIVLLAISLLFFVLLGVKELFSRRLKKKLCVICATVSLVWIVLLVLYWGGLFGGKVIIALLIGQTVLGIFYLLEQKVREGLKLFRLPFLLTLVVAAYTLIEGFDYGLDILWFLFVLWGFFVFVYSMKKNKKIEGFVKKIVECCKKW